jgi:alkylation response protein AidB-like acyl-CoA dehydrogenase
VTNTPPDDLVRNRLAELLAGHNPAAGEVKDFAGAQYDMGLAWVHFPVGHGGLDAPRELQAEVNHAIEQAGGPLSYRINPIGRGMAAPTLLAHGSPIHRESMLRPLFTGEEIWCQLFSEPGAGSDVAGLATSAVRDGDEWVANGQKVWTSLAHQARWGLLLARTDPDQAKHAGLTYFVIDMRDAGIDVRPLRQATGDAEFNEVYLTDVRIPDIDRLGDIGDGWRVAITTLMNERSAIGGRDLEQGSGSIGVALDLWRRLGLDDPILRHRLADLWMRAEALRLTNIRASWTTAGTGPGPEASIGKLFAALLNQAVYELCISMQGAEGLLYGDYTQFRQEIVAGAVPDISRLFVRSPAYSIEGGTSDILRNILAERVLGLPGDVRVDKGIPWRDIPR